MSTSRLDLALRWIRGGSRIVPVHFRTRLGVCTCELGEWCSSERDHFPEGMGAEAATSDEEQIRSWWRKWPAAAVGVLSRSSGHVHLVGPARTHPEPECDGARQLDLFGEVAS